MHCGVHELSRDAGRKVRYFRSCIRRRSEEEIGKMLHMVLKLRHFGKSIRNTGKILKCVAGEGWRRSVSPTA
jgi:hypothetical protein